MFHRQNFLSDDREAQQCPVCSAEHYPAPKGAFSSPWEKTLAVTAQFTANAYVPILPEKKLFRHFHAV